MPKPSFSSSSTPWSSHHLESLPLWLLSIPRAAKMKTKVSGFLKQVVSLLVSIVKAKSVAVKSKTRAVKTRLIIFGLLRNKKVLISAISNKIHALIGQDKEGDATAADDNSMAIVPYKAPSDSTCAEVSESGSTQAFEEEDYEEEEDDGYPDLRHCLFDELEEDNDLGTGSVIELVKNSRGEDQGEFVLEDEIDHVADVFIRRFHKQMRMQKLESFKRYQEMLERSV